MNKNLMLSLLFSAGMTINLSGQFTVSIRAGGAHSAGQITNVSTIPNIVFSTQRESRILDNLNNASLRLDAVINYTFKNNLVAGLHYGKTSFDFSYSLVDLEKGFASQSITGGAFISHMQSYVGKNFEIGKWSLQPYIGVGYRWYPKSNYSDYERKITSSGFGSNVSSSSNGTVIFSMTDSNTNYIFPRFFVPIGFDIKYRLVGMFNVIANLDYQYGFNKAFTRDEVMYKDFFEPELTGFSFIERKNVLSLNLGLGYTFEDAIPTAPKKKRKTLKKDLY